MNYVISKIIIFSLQFKYPSYTIPINGNILIIRLIEWPKTDVSINEVWRVITTWLEDQRELTGELPHPEAENQIINSKQRQCFQSSGITNLKKNKIE